MLNQLKKFCLALSLLALCQTVGYSQNRSVPFYDDFESGLNGWVPSDDGQGNEWDLGTPVFGFTIGAHSGSKCWDVNLNNGYTNNSTCILYSPVFDFTNVANANISFWLKYHVESLWDYLAVQYTVDNGDHWVFMPFPDLINPDGLTPKWIETSLVVSELSGFPNVQFRFIFTADATVTYDGYSFDDFRIDTDPLAVPSTADSPFHFTLYPNPTHGDVTIIYSDQPSENSSIEITDLTGRLILNEPLTFHPDHAVSIHDLPIGTYSVLLKNNSGVWAKKLVVTE